MKMTKPGETASHLLLAVIVAGGIAAGCAEAAHEETARSGPRGKDGAEVYDKICAYCHETQVGPPIRNRKLPPLYIHAVVRNGNRAMPAFRASEIDEESLAKLAEYISGK